MGKYLVLNNNKVISIALSDSAIDSNWKNKENYPGVGIGYYYDASSDSFTQPQSLTFKNNSSDSSSNLISGQYSTASYDATGSLITPEKITSSSFTVTTLYSTPEISQSYWNIKNATIDNYQTSGNNINFDLHPDPSIHPNGEIILSISKDKLVSIDGKEYLEGVPSHVQLVYQSE